MYVLCATTKISDVRKLSVGAGIEDNPEGKSQLCWRTVSSYVVVWIEFCEILRVLTLCKCSLVRIEGQKPTPGSNTLVRGKSLVAWNSETRANQSRDFFPIRKKKKIFFEVWVGAECALGNNIDPVHSINKPLQQFIWNIFVSFWVSSKFVSEYLLYLAFEFRIKRTLPFTLCGFYSFMSRWTC